MGKASDNISIIADYAWAYHRISVLSFFFFFFFFFLVFFFLLLRGAISISGAG